MTSISKQTDHISLHIKQQGVSCTSMVITVFGDVISQHGNWVWLSSLITALEPFGFNERQVRTAVYRLVQSDWLQVNKVGRCSYYCLTESATGHYEKASRRIYASDQGEWDHTWTLVLLVSIPDDKKEEFRKSLIWLGFNALSSGLFAHPSSQRSSLDEVIHELNILKDVVVFKATTDDLYSQGVLKGLTKSLWKFTELEDYYTDFLAFYRPWCQKIFSNLPESRDCFMLRLAMVHDFRRILLRDPDFPNAMLPQGWVGYEALDLVQRSYKILAKPSLSYIQHNLKNAQGTLPDANPNFYNRFGGLMNS